MIKKTLTLISPPLLVFLLVLIVPAESVNAQGFLTCDGVDCSACNLVDTANIVIKWLFGIIFMIFAVMMTVAGFKLITSGGNTSALEDAKSKFTNAIIGLVIVMAAWLLVDTIMRGLLKGGSGEIQGYGPWTDVQCQVQTAPTKWLGDPMSDPNTPPPTGPLPSGCTGGTCVPLAAPCKNASSCSVSPSIVDKINQFHIDAGVSGARVTEGMPPTRAHKSECHNNGTCIDYSKAGGMTGAEVVRVIDAAKKNGLRPVYEVKTQAEKDSLISQGASGDDIKVLGNWISASHFSIYGY
ncbi:MAG: pilin [Candidatus Paceibacterota bacterium]